MNTRPPAKDPARSPVESRQSKLGSALRENLKRRKAQARGRAGAVPESADKANNNEAVKPPPSAGAGLSPYSDLPSPDLPISGSPIEQRKKQDR
jgi:hypothetical protein